MNTLEARRTTLGLSRVKLASILDVDRVSIYRHELRNPMSMLWHYALCGVEAFDPAKAREAAANLYRRNTIKARREKLGLTQVALARVLEVSVHSVHRHERGPLCMLWEYALLGIEAEKSGLSAESELQFYETNLDHHRSVQDVTAAAAARSRATRRKPPATNVRSLA